MGFIFGLIKRLIKFSVYLVLFVTIVSLIPNLPPYTKFSSIEVDPTLPRVGPLQHNEVLNNAQKLYKDKLKGPEAFALYNGELYTSLGSGEVVKLSPGGHVTYVTKLGQPCQGINQEQKCGRPLGLAIDEKGQMFVADAYYGIWQVDIKTDKKQQLVSPQKEIEGRKPMLFNSVALAKNGDLYWTDSSSDYQLNKGAKTLLSDPSGRLLHYSAATKKSKVLVDDLWFANGLVISPDNQFVVVAETNRYRLVKYYIDGPKKGKSEVFLTGLPGTPDNLRALPDGSGFTVGLYAVFDEESPLLAKSAAKTPALRKFLARMLSLTEMPFEFLNNQFPNAALESIANSIGSFQSVSAFIPSTTGLLVVDWSGKIVESYFNTDGTLGHISDAIVYRDQLLTGSPHHQDYVGAVPAPPLLKKAYATTKTTPPPKPAETVTKPTPKPTEAPKPKVEEKKEAPKVAKPAQEPPKPAQPPPKPAQAAKPAQAPKPAEPVRTTPRPTEKKAESTTAKPPATKPIPKQAESATAKPAPAPAKPAKQPEQKPTAPPTKKPEVKVEKVEKLAKPEKKASDTKEKSDKPVPEEIPIIEDIPSDTRKPTKEKLKVIKKGGPTEIPNPAL